MKIRFKEEDEVVEFGLYSHYNPKLTIGQLIVKDPMYVNWCTKNFKGFFLYKKLRNKLEIAIKNK